ncbi:hypothetical protein N0V95_002513 [Ascochyta clinopodiicola]|nr:hypothetical protein N0V95_002513 [Ascochyta clinopodiicola]
MVDQSALAWKYDWFGNLEMGWVKEPDITIVEHIARRELGLTRETPCVVTFLAEGAYNKVYTVQCGPDAHYVLRVTAPVQPRLKTLSEIATINLHLHLRALDDPVTVDEDPEDDSDSDEDPNPYRTPEAIKVRIQRLIDLLPTVLATGELEEYVLHHDDLHESNILVGEDHELSGIIDWESLPTVPLWAACEIPKSLESALDRHECPDPSCYAKEVLDDGSEELNTMYYEHLEEHEKTQLRVFFLEEMHRTCPEWVGVYRHNKHMAASGDTVAVLGDLTNSEIIDEWLDAVEEFGLAPTIGEMLHADEQDSLDQQRNALKAAMDKGTNSTKEK